MKLISILLISSILFANQQLFIGNSNLINKQHYTKQNVRGVSRYSVKVNSSETIYAYMTYGKPTMLVFDYPIVQSIPSPPSYFRTIAYNVGSNYITIMPIVDLQQEFDGSVIHITLHRGPNIPDLVYSIEVVLTKLGNENDRIRILSDDEEYFTQKRIDNELKVTQLQSELSRYQQAYGLVMSGKDNYELSYNLATNHRNMEIILQTIRVSSATESSNYYKFIMQVNKVNDQALQNILNNTKVSFFDADSNKNIVYTPIASTIDIDRKTYLMLGFEAEKIQKEVNFEIILDGSRINGIANFKPLAIKQNTSFRIGF